MSMINYPAFFVTLATIFLLVVQTAAPSAILTIVLVVLIPLVITAGLFNYLEGHLYKDEWGNGEQGEYESDPDYDYYVSSLK